jgi:hypothetical protein
MHKLRVCLSFAILAMASPPSVAQELGWVRYAISGSGTSVDYPSRIFVSADTPAGTKLGQRFRTADGRADLLIAAFPNAGTSPNTFLRDSLRVPESLLTYRRVAPTFFAVSGVDRGRIHYGRCNFSRRTGGMIHCIYLQYPVGEKRAWDGIVTRLSRSLRPLYPG